MSRKHLYYYFLLNSEFRLYTYYFRIPWSAAASSSLFKATGWSTLYLSAQEATLISVYRLYFTSLLQKADIGVLLLAHITRSNDCLLCSTKDESRGRVSLFPCQLAAAITYDQFVPVALASVA